MPTATLDRMPGQEDGMISAVVSPVQLAAVLDGATVSKGETLGNRLWGAVGLVGGTLELLGSAALLVDPDPTVSKVVGVIGVVHGSDVITTSWDEIRTGQSRATATAQATAALAQALGLSPEDASKVGALVDIAIPTGVASSVARTQSLARLTRIGSVRSGYISLVNEEQTFNVGKGAAHTIRDHVGKTMGQMLDRFTRKPSLQATGSFASVGEAEQVVSKILRANRSAIKAWASNPATGRPLQLSQKFGKSIGQGVLNSAKVPGMPAAAYAGQPVRTATIILNKTVANGRTWYVMTAFPDIMRDLGLVAM